MATAVAARTGSASLRSAAALGRQRPAATPWQLGRRVAAHSTAVSSEYGGWTAWGPPPPAVFAIGLNYKKHAAETGLPEPAFPVVFMKPSSSIIGDGDAIEIPSACSP
jgi:2-keto-4-pentenoate hydratase/2-oxohepta-3-ene-1,7-dioic acid hydratase in catechol pathway